MTSTFSVDALKIASPCPASWEGMTGDDRTRHCRQCDKKVYNIAAMTSLEVEALVKQTEGEFCGRLYRRRDGRVLTADCPVGKRLAPKRMMKRLIAGAFIGLGLLTTGAVVHASTRTDWDWPPSGPGVSADDYWDWVLTTIGIRPKPRALGGAMLCPPASLPSRIASEDL